MASERSLLRAALLIRNCPQLSDLRYEFAKVLDAERETAARRCAEIASEIAASYTEFPSLHAIGAETVGCKIRREFSLESAHG